MTDHDDVTEVTEVEPFTEPRLRAALTHVLRLDVRHEGSLYLRALACCTSANLRSATALPVSAEGLGADSRPRVPLAGRKRKRGPG